MMPWEKIEKKYAKNFENNGHPAFNVRVAFGALIIKERYKCSDEMTVEQISENPYLQYFIGEKEYTSKCPFSAVS